MTLGYVTDKKGKRTGILLPLKEWELIQKKLNSRHFYEDFKASAHEIKQYKEGRIELKDASHLFTGDTN